MGALRKAVANRTPAIIQRAREIEKCLAAIPKEARKEHMIDEAFQAVRLAMHDPKFAPCGDTGLKLLRGWNELFLQQQGSIDNRQYTYIIQIANQGPEALGQFIREGERKLLEAPVIEAIDTTAEEE